MAGRKRWMIIAAAVSGSTCFNTERVRLRNSEDVYLGEGFGRMTYINLSCCCVESILMIAAVKFFLALALSSIVSFDF